MLITLTTTHRPATDLGFLLHKNPDKLHSFELSFGKAHVFYSEASEERCTAVLVLDVDPIALVRGKKRGDSGLLGHYVNDRPYVASSFLSVALSRVYRTAFGGRCKHRPDLAATAIPLTARIVPLPCRAGEPLLRRLFEPLGYGVSVATQPLDPKHPEWGDSPYFAVTLSAECRLADLLNHLSVLIPVLDNEKHYWVGDDEVDKLLRRGEGWLADHPEKELIATRYLKYQRRLAREVLARLSDEDDPDPDAATVGHAAEEQALEKPIRLNDLRLETVLHVVRDSGAHRVLDLGCGEGRLLRLLLKEKQLTEIVGLDASVRALEVAHDRLRLDRMPPRQRQRLTLLHGSLTYRDQRLAGYDAATAIEVIEHLDPPRLGAFERVLFEAARPETVVITTPNVEYNVKFENLAAGAFRHRDHRFEWSRAEFRDWASGVAARHDYEVDIRPIGEADPELGAPSQMAVFSRCS